MMFKDVCSGITPAGIEYYLPKNAVVITLEGVLEKAEQFWQEVVIKDISSAKPMDRLVAI